MPGAAAGAAGVVHPLLYDLKLVVGSKQVSSRPELPQQRLPRAQHAASSVTPASSGQNGRRVTSRAFRFPGCRTAPVVALSGL